MFEDVEKHRLMDGESRSSAESDSRNATEHATLYIRSYTVRSKLLYLSIAVPWLLLCIVSYVSWTTIQYHKSRYYIRPDLVYSEYINYFRTMSMTDSHSGPVQDLIRYETKIFTTGLPKEDDPDISPYAQEPSDEVDKLWTSLYPSMSASNLSARLNCLLIGFFSSGRSLPAHRQGSGI